MTFKDLNYQDLFKFTSTSPYSFRKISDTKYMYDLTYEVFYTKPNTEVIQVSDPKDF